MRCAFFTSTGRTGTFFFTHLFNTYVDNAWSLHEPHPAFRRRSRQFLRRQPNLYEKYYFAIPRKLRHIRSDKLWYMETNYHLFAAIPLIRRAFPEAIIAHTIRDGRDIVQSWLNRFRYITNDHIRPEDAGDEEARRKWSSWNPLQKTAWYWKTVNEFAYAHHPDIWIRYEDLFKSDRREETLLDILSRFDDLVYDPNFIVRALDAPINKTKTEFFPRYSEWPSAWRDQFCEIAGDTMQKFGYAI